MVQKCWPSKYNCQIHNHRSVGRSHTSTPDSYAPSYTTLGTPVQGASWQKHGRNLQKLGLAQMANAHLSRPPKSSKIWTGMTRGDAKLHSPDMLKNSRKYDWRPRGDSYLSGVRDSGLYGRSKKRPRKGGLQTEHWRRQPKYNQGIYSQPTEYDLHSHRKSQTRKGAVKAGIGTGIRFLGRGVMIFTLGQYASWLYNDPSDRTVGRIVQDITFSQQINDYFVEPWKLWLQPDATISS